MLRVWNYNKSRIHSFRGQTEEIKVRLGGKRLNWAEVRLVEGSQSTEFYKVRLGRSKSDLVEARIKVRLSGRKLG